MRQKFFTARNGLIALIAVLCCICLFFGAWLTASRSAYADESTEPTEEETDTTIDTETDNEGETDGEDTETPENIVFSMTGWKYGSFDSQVNLKIDGSANLTIVFYDTDDEVLSIEINNGEISDEDLTSINSLDVKDYSVVAYEGETPVSETLAISVLKAENYWVVSPNLISWKWGDFDESINKIYAQSAFGNETLQFIILKDTALAPSDSTDSDELPFLVYDYEGIVPNGSEDGKKSNLFFKLNSDGSLPEYVVDVLKNLDAGEYYLIPSGEVNPNNYTQEKINNGTMYPFNVLRTDNRWERTPSIVQWAWGEFNVKVNTITGVPKYYDDNTFVSYGIYSQPYENVDYALKGLANFKVASFTEGEVESSIAELLNKLDAGTYYLRAITTDKNKNYNDLDTFIQFYVTKVQNHWTSTPNIIRWTWGGYNKDINVITAVPALPTVNAEVLFSVYTDETLNYYVEGLYKFTEIGSDEAAALSGLEAKTYYLKAETADTNNYSGLSSVIAFTVLKAQNYWASTPNVVQWTWNEFKSSVNTISAVPTYPAKGAKITYGIFSDKNCKVAVEGLEEFAAVTDEIGENLNSLPAGNYWLKTVSEGGDNYTGLESVVSFKVEQIQNTWATSPYVLGWQYGEYDRTFNLIYANPKYGNAIFSIFRDEDCTDPVVFIETYNGNNTNFVLGADGYVSESTASIIKNLDAGTYYLVVKVEGTNNYTDINISTQSVPVPFEVKHLENYWLEIPGLIGWSEGNFNSSVNTVSGMAKEGTVKLTVTNDKNTVLYIITLKDGEITSVTKANGEHTELDELNKLPVGSYTLLAEVASTDNYSQLTAKADFAVFEDSVGLSGIIAAVITFAVFDVLAAGACVTLLILRRRKIEQQFRNMIKKELNRR